MHGQVAKVLNLPKTIFQSRPFATPVNTFSSLFPFFTVRFARLPFPLFLYHQIALCKHDNNIDTANRLCNV